MRIKFAKELMTEWAARKPAQMAAFAVAAIVLLTVAITLAVVTINTPPTLRSSSEGLRIPVTEQEYTDSQSVELALTIEGKRELTSKTSGIVTSNLCVAGEKLKSGQRVLDVNGEPILALYTPTPLWRDMALGTGGEDVRQLQKELTRLGYRTEASGTFSAATGQALSQLMRRYGKDSGDGLRLSNFAWLPAEEATVVSCALSLGQALSREQAIATFTPELTGAKVTRLPANLQAEREFIVDGKNITVGKDGAVDREGLKIIAASSGYAQALQAVGAGGPGQGMSQGQAVPKMNARYAVKQGQKAYVVPPSAVYADSHGKSCVSNSKGAQEVKILGSELGKTFIVFTQEPYEEVEARPDKSVKCS